MVCPSLTCLEGDLGRACRAFGQAAIQRCLRESPVQEGVEEVQNDELDRHGDTRRAPQRLCTRGDARTTRSANQRWALKGLFLPDEGSSLVEASPGNRYTQVASNVSTFQPSISVAVQV